MKIDIRLTSRSDLVNKSLMISVFSLRIALHKDVS